MKCIRFVRSQEEEEEREKKKLSQMKMFLTHTALKQKIYWTWIDFCCRANFQIKFSVPFFLLIRWMFGNGPLMLWGPLYQCILALFVIHSFFRTFFIGKHDKVLVLPNTHFVGTLFAFFAMNIKTDHIQNSVDHLKKNGEEHFAFFMCWI